MIRADRFRVSARPYAVDLSSLATHSRERQDGSTYYAAQVDAAWFRRRRGVTVAVAGTLWNFQDAKPATAIEFLVALTDGRYGGRAVARWDGSNLWAPEMPYDQQERHHERLHRMLTDYPNVPAGHDGWWTFQEVPSQ